MPNESLLDDRRRTEGAALRGLVKCHVRFLDFWSAKISGYIFGLPKSQIIFLDFWSAKKSGWIFGLPKKSGYIFGKQKSPTAQQGLPIDAHQYF